MQTGGSALLVSGFTLGRFSADAACEKESVRPSGLDTKPSEVTEIPPGNANLVNG